MNLTAIDHAWSLGLGSSLDLGILDLGPWRIPPPIRQLQEPSPSPPLEERAGERRPFPSIPTGRLVEGGPLKSEIRNLRSALHSIFPLGICLGFGFWDLGFSAPSIQSRKPLGRSW